ncbi:MAG: hypothetical protein WBC51_22685, partial [Vicinamibacterales bacterium]
MSHATAPARPCSATTVFRVGDIETAIGRLRVTGPPVALRVLRYGTAVGLLVQATAQRIIAREPTHAR